MRVEPWRAGRKEWQNGVVKSRIDKRPSEVDLRQGLLRRNCVHLRKSNEAPIKVEDDHDVTEAREQSSTETREDTREQTPPDTRVETFDQPRDPPLWYRTQLNRPVLCKHREGPHASVSCPSVFRTLACLSLRTLQKN